MMLDIFTEPQTVTCILCRATVSIRKGDKARFYNHISHDHEVHYDMDLFYVVSFLNMDQKKTVVDIINEKLLSNEEMVEDQSAGNTELEEESPIVENEVTTALTICKNVLEEKDSESSTPSYLKIIQKFYENTKTTKEQGGQAERVDASEKDNGKYAVNATLKEGVTKANPNDTVSPSKRKEKCSVCDMMVSRKNMRIHMRIRHKAGPSKEINAGQIVDCSFCSKKLRKSSLSRHMRIVHKQKKDDLENVSHDGATENVSEMLKDNMEKQTAKDCINIKRENVECQKPNKETLKSKGAEKKKSIKNNPKDKQKETESGYRKCKLCFKNLKSNYYRRHLKEAHSGIQNKCELCYTVFSRKETVKDHIERVHKLEVELLDKDLNPKFTKDDCTFQCRSCNKKFISEAVMKYHDTRKHGSGNIECETCHKRFKDKTAINKHKTTCIVIDTLMP